MSCVMRDAMVNFTHLVKEGRMRTTLDIADDVLLSAKALARRDKTSVGAVISELARRSLLRSVEHPLLNLGIRPLPTRGGVVSNELINELLDDGGY
jgi:hypothetical protein